MTTTAQNLADLGSKQQLEDQQVIKKFGLEDLEKGADLGIGVQGSRKILKTRRWWFLGKAGKAAMAPFTQGSIDLGIATARKALKDYEDELAEYERDNRRSTNSCF